MEAIERRHQPQAGLDKERQAVWITALNGSDHRATVRLNLREAEWLARRLADLLGIERLTWRGATAGGDSDTPEERHRGRLGRLEHEGCSRILPKPAA